MKKLFAFFLATAITLTLTACSDVTQEDYDLLTQEKTELAEKIAEIEDENASLALTIEEQNVTIEEMQSRIDAFAELEEKYGSLSDSEIDAQTAANDLKAEEDRLAQELLLEQEAAEQAAAEAAAAEEAEAEAKLGYETGITYDDLSRNPSDYEEKKVKFTGEVLQVTEVGSEVQIRLATKPASYGGYNDDVIYVFFDSSLIASRLLEDDIITIYGVSKNLYTYETIMGGSVTLPLIQVDNVEIN